jgi:hypothetical protein
LFVNCAGFACPLGCLPDDLRQYIGLGESLRADTERLAHIRGRGSGGSPTKENTSGSKTFDAQRGTRMFGNQIKTYRASTEIRRTAS